MLVRFPRGRGLDPHRVETDDAGRFAIDPLEPGGCAVTAIARGWAAGGVQLTKNADRAAEVRIALERGGVIRGRVLDAQGAPAVIVYEGRHVEGRNGREYNVTRSEKAGAIVRVDRLAAAEHTVGLFDEDEGARAYERGEKTEPKPAFERFVTTHEPPTETALAFD